MNNTMIEVALGMALLYAVLSLFVTMIQEYTINAAGGRRGLFLREAVRSAFGEDERLTDAFFNHPMILSLARGTGKREPSYIPDDVFAKVYLAVLGNGQHPKTLGLTPAAFMAGLGTRTAAASDPTPDGRVIQGAYGGAAFTTSLRLVTADSAAANAGAGDWGAFEADVARWFGDIGERSSGWFKRSAQRWTLAIAFLLAVGMNIDSVMIARTLWSDAALRRQLADAAVALNDAVRTNASEDSTARRSAAEPTLAERYTQLQDNLNALNTRLKSDAFLSERSLFGISCETATPGPCGHDAVIGTHCVGATELPTGTRALFCTDRGKNNNVPKFINPALEWAGQLNQMTIDLASGRDASTREGRALELDAALQARVAKVQRTLGAILSDMIRVRAKTPDPKGKASQLIDSLMLDIQTLQNLSGELFRFAAPAQTERASAECSMQFDRESAAWNACAQRRRSEMPFPLPLGYEPSVVARQLSADGLRRCAPPNSCDALTQLWLIASNGAFVGWLLTAIALSLGAPFWFDTIGRLAKLRASGGPPAEQDESPRKSPAPVPPPGSPPAEGAAPPSPVPGSPSGTSDVASNLEANLSRDEVMDVQRKLQVEPTGSFDTATRNAINARRMQLGMGPGSVLDATLYLAIVERRSLLVQPRPVLKLNSRDTMVGVLRKRLIDLLEIPTIARGGRDPDLFDAELRAAVKLFQGRAGLEPDGVVGEVTWRALDNTDATSPADRWMKRAISQLGLNERDDKDAIRVQMALAGHGGDDPAQTAWCACFVTWVTREVRPTCPQEPAAAKSWINWGTPITGDVKPAYGDVVVLQEKPNSGTDGQARFHVAFLVGETSTGWTVLGGNQGDPGAVSVTLFSAGTHNAVYFGRPAVA